MSNTEKVTEAGARVGVLRLWPAVLIAVIHVGVTVSFHFLGSTAVQSAIGIIGAPIVAGLLLIIWWLAASRAPWRARLVGVAVFLAGVACVKFSHKAQGEVLLIYALPAMTFGSVALLLVLSRVAWGMRRWVLVAYLVACTVVFSMMRADSVTGNLVPVVSWRWTASADQRSKAMAISGKHGKAVLPDQAGPGDWPAFRGPVRDGRLSGVTFSTNWTTPPKELWRRKVGLGWSSFAAVGDYVFTQEEQAGKELVTCYRADTGGDVWVNQVDASRDDAMGAGPRATPTYDHGKLYTQGATGIFQCIDAATGATVWKRDLTKDTGTGVPNWGFSSSPLVVGELVYVFSGGPKEKSVAAYRLATGDIAWSAGQGGGGYSSPHYDVMAGVPQIIMIGDAGVQGLAPDTGALLWEHLWKTDINPRVVQPLVFAIDSATEKNVKDPAVMVGTTGIVGTRLLRVVKKDAAWNVEEVWTTKKFRPYFDDYVLHKDHCYGFDGDRLACMEAATGKICWMGKKHGGQLVLLTDMDAFLVLTEKGEVLLVGAKPDAYTEIAQFKAISGKTWNHPVVAHGRLFVRNAEEAACYQLAP